MDLKKSPEADLENRRVIHIFIGFIVAFSLILISFEWTTPLDMERDLANSREIAFDMDLIRSIPREESRPELKKTLPEIRQVIEIVEEDVPLEEFRFDPEVGNGTEYPYWNQENPEPEEIDEPPVPFGVLEDQPLFNGGDPAVEFTKYIARNLKYPQIAIENGVYGKVIVQFIIDKRGELVDPVIVRSVDPALDAEALRVIMSSPGWTPGKQVGRPVKVIYTFPINFVLQ